MKTFGGNSNIDQRWHLFWNSGLCSNLMKDLLTRNKSPTRERLGLLTAKVNKWLSQTQYPAELMPVYLDAWSTSCYVLGLRSEMLNLTNHIPLPQTLTL